MASKKLEEFHKYCEKMDNRESKQILKSVSFRISLFITNLIMFLGFNKRIQKKDSNRSLNVGAGNVFFDNISNTDLFPSVGQILKGNLKRNSNKANKYYLNIFKTEKSFLSRWDGIVLSHVLEHINPCHSKMVLLTLKSYLSENGILRILVPNPEVYFNKITEISPQGYKSNILSLNNLFYGWSHRFMYSSELLIELLLDSGFTDVKVVDFGTEELSQFDFKERKFESLCIVAKK
ncbi:methyltransferase domain-containing protein [Flavobacterium sp.]|uniref:methyltransferase domain-containing protein n=1 Tax=Flavobacterium sp. TaxID=239 RepID=UPI0040473D24